MMFQTYLTSTRPPSAPVSRSPTSLSPRLNDVAAGPYPPIRIWIVLLTSSPLRKLAIGIIGWPRWHGYDCRAVPGEAAMRGRLVAAAIAFALASAGPACAQGYPSRPITLVVPLGVGGSTDVIGRLMVEGMRAALGQPVIVENTTGAGGTVGVGRVARAAPDGYTIGIGQWGTNVATGAIYPLAFDLLNDFEPVGLIATQPFL